MNENEVLSKVVSVLHTMTQDWDLELPSGIGPDTRLMDDLAFESIDVVQFAMSVEQAFDTSGLPFEKLFLRDGDYVDDIQVKEIAVFLTSQLAA